MSKFFKKFVQTFQLYRRPEPFSSRCSTVAQNNANPSPKSLKTFTSKWFFIKFLNFEWIEFLLKISRNNAVLPELGTTLVHQLLAIHSPRKEIFWHSLRSDLLNFYFSVVKKPNTVCFVEKLPDFTNRGLHPGRPRKFQRDKSLWNVAKASTFFNARHADFNGHENCRNHRNGQNYRERHRSKGIFQNRFWP